MKNLTTYEAQINGGNWQEVSAEKLLFLLLPLGIVTAYRKKHEGIECAHVTIPVDSALQGGK